LKSFGALWVVSSLGPVTALVMVIYQATYVVVAIPKTDNRRKCLKVGTNAMELKQQPKMIVQVRLENTSLTRYLL